MAVEYVSPVLLDITINRAVQATVRITTGGVIRTVSPVLFENFVHAMTGAFAFRYDRFLVEGAENLCDVVVFVQEASGAVAPADAEGLEVDDVFGQGPQWRGLAEGSVWPM